MWTLVRFDANQKVKVMHDLQTCDQKMFKSARCETKAKFFFFSHMADWQWAATREEGQCIFGL